MGAVDVADARVRNAESRAAAERRRFHFGKPPSMDEVTNTNCSGLTNVYGFAACRTVAPCGTSGWPRHVGLQQGALANLGRELGRSTMASHSVPSNSRRLRANRIDEGPQRRGHLAWRRITQKRNLEMAPTKARASTRADRQLHGSAELLSGKMRCPILRSLPGRQIPCCW